jgi:hypothetical protein
VKLLNKPWINKSRDQTEVGQSARLLAYSP